MGEKKGIPNIEPAISFLWNRVTKGTVEDKENMKRVLHLLKQIISDKRVIGEGNLRQLCTRVDAAYALKPNLNIHTDNGMPFRYGLAHCNYRKKNWVKKFLLRPK